ncbi:LacI family DNA-binding transcriptional regulator [Massilia violaceinigra]|uniref:LacI family DNA-binding transcriptional regulator n=1 Tax=Massilia violaceinigra TaxID=2045208 RepID=A0ABY3ZZ77_9BURK|nr:LacI family DNA-binding transcriptional regulator [Massilia violaceinigra]UOD27240.1 LacI family DNA-binding transcriptional regulator [Massilia violaceinigra]
MRTSENGPVTLHQVAHAAGVSPATASRFMNGTARVSDAKRRSIEDAIERLNYKPNLVAQGLKMGSTRTIGVLTQSLVSGYFNDAMVGIEDAVKAAGYALLIMSGHWHAAEEAERVELLIGRRVDGVVILTGNMSDTQILDFSQRVPIVAFGRKLEGERVFGFFLDNYGAACEAMELLIEQGHRRIAFIRGSDDQEDAHARLAGYRDTLAKHRIEPDPGLIVAGDFQESGGLQAVNQLLSSGARFSAIFAANDLSAYGARLALYRRSIRVPEDVSIIGFDDLHSSMYTTPPLTTVRQPLYDVGSCIGTMMLGMIGHDEVKVPLPALSLVVRESVRRLT